MNTCQCQYRRPGTGFLCWLALVAWVILPAFAQAATVSVLYNFATSTGANPTTGLLLSGSLLYGGTLNGGGSSDGVVFKVPTNNGAAYSDFFNFGGGSGGANPAGGPLVLTNGLLYGTTENAGTNSRGMVYQVSTSGANFKDLYSFSAEDSNGYNQDGANPMAGVLVSGNKLYGTTSAGGEGTSPYGTVFRVNLDGTGFTNLYNFNGPDGQMPQGSLILSGNTLYGATGFGGTDPSGWGTLFKINTDGSGFNSFYSFNSGSGNAPNGGLVLSGNTLYGTTSNGGPGTGGAVYRVNTDGMDFTNLYSFTQDNYGNAPNGTEPSEGLVLSGNTLYGTTSNGGSHYGVLFAINTDGSGFTNLFNFSYSTSGETPNGLILAGNTLYGVTSRGGSSGEGTIFYLAIPPPPVPPVPIPLNIQVNDAAVVLSWTNQAFSLWAAPTCSGVYTNVAGATSPYTNSFSGPQQFFRLQAN
jgi:uncharacterized repeat protein (TIGR03803 family)